MKRTVQSALHRRACLSPPSASRRSAFLASSTCTNDSRRWLSQVPKDAGRVEVQRVSIQSRRFTWKKIVTIALGTGLGTAGAVFLLSLLTVDDDDDDVEEGTDVSFVAESLVEDVSKGSGMATDGPGGLGLAGHGPRQDDHVGSPIDADNEEEDADYIPDETPDNAWFIPLGRVEKLPRTYYTGDDPVWQEYKRFQSDQPRRTRVMDELTDKLLSAIRAGGPPWSILGQDVRCQRRWLDVDFPLGPPQEYQQLGLEWAPEYIAILHRTRDPQSAQRIAKALWPDTVTSSAYTTAKHVFNGQYARMKKALGLYEEETKPAFPLSVPASIRAAQNPMATKTAVPSTEAAKEDSREESKSAAGQPDILSMLPDYPQPDQITADGIRLFKRNVARKWKQSPQLSSGCIVIRGTVEYGGTNGIATLEVTALYSILDNVYTDVVARTRRLVPRRLYPRQQRG